jgi:tRNA(adenine34) deaminase
MFESLRADQNQPSLASVPVEENGAMNDHHERFMRAALEEAKRARESGNMAVGAVIVRGDEILARGCNEVDSTFDATARAEVMALRSLTTGRRQVNRGMQADSGPFAGAVLYTTVEPCPMCCWATCITGLSAIVLGARHAGLGISFGQYTGEGLIALSKQRMRVITGILTEECMAMFRSGPSRTGPR